MVRAATKETEVDAEEARQFQEQSAEKTRKEQLANFLGQGRYETRILVDVLNGSSKPIQYREILARVNQRVKFDGNDGLTPPYKVTPTLVSATLGMMADLGAITKMNRRWRFTERGHEVVGLLIKPH